MEVFWLALIRNGNFKLTIEPSGQADFKVNYVELRTIVEANPMKTA